MELNNFWQIQIQQKERICLNKPIAQTRASRCMALHGTSVTTDSLKPRRNCRAQNVSIRRIFLWYAMTAVRSAKHWNLNTMMLLLCQTKGSSIGNMDNRPKDNLKHSSTMKYGKVTNIQVPTYSTGLSCCHGRWFACLIQTERLEKKSCG